MLLFFLIMFFLISNAIVSLRYLQLAFYRQCLPTLTYEDRKTLTWYCGTKSLLPDLEELCLCEGAQSCLTLCEPVDRSPQGSSVHGIFQARILEWLAISYSSRSAQLRDRIAFLSSPELAGGSLLLVPLRRPSE